jgi:hypothetical protein
MQGQRMTGDESTAGSGLADKLLRSGLFLERHPPRIFLLNTTSPASQ